LKVFDGLILILIIPLFAFSITYELLSNDPRVAFLEMVNEYRIVKGLQPFECLFNEVPQAFTDFQANIGIFLGHIGFSKRVERIKKLIEENYGMKVSKISFAENVAFLKSDDIDLKMAFESFLKSKRHRENILSSRYRWTAIGITKKSDRLYICQIFWNY
jgi:hypothetical protein